MKRASTVAPHRVRQLVLERAWKAHVGHIGCALSVVDILCALYSGVLRVPRLRDPDRDRFILSKGHAALALYAVFHLRGWISRKALDSYCRDGSLLGVHPEHALAGVDFSTGSLGQGLSYGAGAALAARLQRSDRRAYVLLSDAECDEGSVWETAMFAAHHKLSNLVAIVDLNGQQAMGHTKDILDLSPMAQRWRAFGWEAVEVDGHDIPRLTKVLSRLDLRSGPPHVLVARTRFGKGVPYMEGQVKWHYWPMSEDEYKEAAVAVGSGRG